MDYAVIRTGGKQYRVAPGDIIHIEKLAGEAGTAVEFTDVLMTSSGGSLAVGTPTLTGAKVIGEILRQSRAKKIRVFKKKRRKNYSRQYGHRQYQTTVRVTGIEAGATHGS
jgi:large subunit ribosomal protein L21